MTKREAIAFIIEHVQEFPDLHKTPEHLVNTYSALGGHPVRYCRECGVLIDEFQIGHIDGLKKGMWHAYYEAPNRKKEADRE